MLQLIKDNFLPIIIYSSFFIIIYILWEQPFDQMANNKCYDVYVVGDELDYKNKNALYFDDDGALCEENYYDCSDFCTQEDAQRAFNDCGGLNGRDVHRLDADKNGVACEDL